MLNVGAERGGGGGGGGGGRWRWQMASGGNVALAQKEAPLCYLSQLMAKMTGCRLFMS
jgi:hypothetical protein